ncbi:MAG: M28 family metallopeptidase [Thermoanaerobaculia bacterium]
MKTSLVALTVLLAGSALFAADSTSLPPGAEKAAEAINAHTLAAPVHYLADDLLEGRGPATRGDELARLYLQTRMEDLGLQPADDDGTWQQKFDIVGINSQMPEKWSFKTRSGEVSFDKGSEFMAYSGRQKPEVDIRNAELVFVGYGIQAPEYKWDDFKGADLHGKVLVMLNSDPDWDPNLFQGKTRLYYGRWTYKYESAARQGAAGAIIIHTTPSAGYPWQVVQTSWGGVQYELPAESEPRVDVRGWLTEAAAQKLLQMGGFDLAKLTQSARSRDFRPMPLGITTSIDLKNEISRKTTGNVLGLLPGTDLKDQVVVYSAHHDHLGVGSPDANGDRIYNGALDNASGCAEVLSIAEAFQALPERPRRSILFLFVAGEEQGLLGSKYYSLHPTFAPGKIAADINFDGGNILGKTKDLTLIGMGKSSLDRIATAFAAKQGRVVEPDQFPDRGFYYRSDQFSFAKIGVPALYFGSGTDFVGRPEGWGRTQREMWEAKHYHQPSDEIDSSWNFDGMIENTRLGFFAGLAIADADQMPVWNPGDEFAAARTKALADVSGGH